MAPDNVNLTKINDKEVTVVVNGQKETVDYDKLIGKGPSKVERQFMSHVKVNRSGNNGAFMLVFDKSQNLNKNPQVFVYKRAEGQTGPEATGEFLGSFRKDDLNGPHVNNINQSFDSMFNNNVENIGAQSFMGAGIKWDSVINDMYENCDLVNTEIVNNRINEIGNSNDATMNPLQSRVSGTIDTLQENKRSLSNIDKKAGEMNAAADEFEAMARELKNQTGFFAQIANGFNELFSNIASNIASAFQAVGKFFGSLVGLDNRKSSNNEANNNTADKELKDSIKSICSDMDNTTAIGMSVSELEAIVRSKFDGQDKDTLLGTIQEYSAQKSEEQKTQFNEVAVKCREKGRGYIANDFVTVKATTDSGSLMNFIQNIDDKIANSNDSSEKSFLESLRDSTIGRTDEMINASNNTKNEHIEKLADYMNRREECKDIKTRVGDTFLQSPESHAHQGTYKGNVGSNKNTSQNGPREPLLSHHNSDFSANTSKVKERTLDKKAPEDENRNPNRLGP